MLRVTFFIVLCLSILCLNKQPYSRDDSLYYAYLSAATHCTKQQVQSWDCKICKNFKKGQLQNISYLENQQTQIVGLIGYDNLRNKILISWRGSVDQKNWIQDLTYLKQPYFQCKGCEVHSGFYLSYKSIQKQVNTKVEILLQQRPSATIQVTGHSLGGSLAQICGIQLQLKYKKVSLVHSFASPRVGNINFSAYCVLKIPTIYRIVHNRDIVPHLPPQNSGFHHTPFEVLYDQKMINFQVCDQTGEDKNCSDKYAPNFTPNDHVFYFLDMNPSAC